MRGLDQLAAGHQLVQGWRLATAWRAAQLEQLAASAQIAGGSTPTPTLPSKPSRSHRSSSTSPTAGSDGAAPLPPAAIDEPFAQRATARRAQLLDWPCRRSAHRKRAVID